jgi:branched-chain amino acid transport system permease protein
MEYGGFLLFAAIFAFLPLFLSSYGVSLLTEILIYGILVLSLNLLMGYTGLPSFGHAVFFGVSAYMLAFLITKVMPGGGLLHSLIVIGLAILSSLVTAMVLGLLVVQSSGLIFLMLTVSLAQVFWAIAFSWRTLTGGEDGIAGISRPDLGLPISLNETITFYYVVFVCFILSWIILQSIVRSPFGKALIGIRVNELRMRAFGYNTWIYKYLAYVIAGVFGGLAGVLNTYFYRYVSPNELGIEVSGIAMFMVIIGSRDIFFGPVVGVVVVLLLKHLIGSLTEYWQFFLGLVFIFSVMYARKGISAFLIDHVTKLFRRPGGSFKT